MSPATTAPASSAVQETLVSPAVKVVKELSKEALRKRVERLMKKSASGEHKVPTELVDEWNKGSEHQNKLISEFESAGLMKEWGLWGYAECKRMCNS